MEPSRRGGGEKARPRPVLLLILALALAGNWVFLDPQATLQGTDWDQIHLPYAVQTCRAIQDHGTLPFWSGLLYAGYPAFATPDKPSFYPPFLLLASFLPPPAVMNVSLLLHMLLAGLGAFALARALLRDEGAALAAAALLMLGPGRSLAYGAPFHFWSYAWLPWMLLALLHAEEPPARLRAAALGGITIALFVHAGGAAPNPLLLGVPLVAWFAIGYGRAPDGWRGRGKALLLAGAVGGLLAAPKVLPGIEWTRLTDRAEALAPEVLQGLVWSPVSWAPTAEGLLPLVPIALGLLALARRPRDRSLWLFMAMVAAGMVLATGWLQGTVFPHVPLLDRVRSAYRTFRIANLALAIAGAYGIAEIGRWIPRRAGLRHPSTIVAGVLAAGLLAVSLVVTMPKLHAAQAREDTIVHSVPLLEEVRRITRAEEGSFEGRGRFHVFEHDQVPDERAQAFSVPLGIETLQGHVGAFRWKGFSDYLRQSTKDPARMWAILGVRWIAAGHPLASAAFEPVRRFERAPRRAVPLADGPYLFRNLRCPPRAFVPPRALWLEGPPDAVRKAALRILWLPEFDARRVAIVAPSSSSSEPPLPASWIRSVFDGIVSCGPGPRGELAAASLPGAGDPSAAPSSDRPAAARAPTTWVRFALPGPGGASDAIDTRELPRWLASITESPVPVPLREDGPNGRILETGNLEGRVIVLAERFAWVPGWTAAREDREPVPLLAANGVATAVVIPPRKLAATAEAAAPPSGSGNPLSAPASIRLAYTAPGLRWGHVLAVLGAALVGGAFLLGGRVRSAP